MKFVLAAAALAAASLVAVAAQADVLFSNLGVDDSYDSGIGWTVSAGDSDIGFYDAGEGFVATQDADLTQIELALSNLSGDNSATISLWTDGLGAQLGSWVVSGLPAFGTLSPLTTISGISGIHLDAGATYVLQASANSGNWHAWNWNNIGGAGQHYFTGGSFENTQGAFRITGDLRSAAPEPAAWALMLVGFGGLGVALRRRRGQALAAA